MPIEPNPYEPVHIPTSQTGPFEVTPLRVLLRSKRDRLLEILQERTSQGWELATTSPGNSTDEYLIWKRVLMWKHAEHPATTVDSDCEYRIISMPSLLRTFRLWNTGPLDASTEKELNNLGNGWTLAAFIPSVGMVFKLCKDDTTPSQFTTLKCSPRWWRTLIGSSWIRVMNDDLNRLTNSTSKIVGYIGQDTFIVRKIPESLPSALDATTTTRRYHLATWPNWKRLILPGTPNFAPWFASQAEQDWNLVCHYQGALFLFAKEETAKNGGDSRL